MCRSVLSLNYFSRIDIELGLRLVQLKLSLRFPVNALLRVNFAVPHINYLQVALKPTSRLEYGQNPRKNKLER